MSNSILVSRAPSTSSLNYLDKGILRNKKAPRMVIRTEDRKTSVTFPFGPQAFSMTNIAPTYTQVQRPGRSPLLIRTDPGLAVMTFTLILAHLDNQASVQPHIDKLKVLAQTHSTLEVRYGSISAGQWRMTSHTVNGTRRNLHNEVSYATAEIELTRASDISVSAGPVSGGVKKPKSSSSSSSSSSKSGATKKKPPFIYTVKRGDTLWAICNNHYHDPSKWRAVATYNKLANPNKIKVGQKLVLP